MRIAKSIRALEAYVPGEQPKSKSVVKLNTNENPYPPSPACAKVLASFDLDRLRRYPDPVFNDLRTALARLYRTDVRRIFVGNGSDEVLSVAARAFVEDDEAIGSLNPSYSLYRTLADIRGVAWRGADVDFETADEAAVLRAARATAKERGVSLFLWTNPNAPTGTRVSGETLAAFAKGFRGVLLVDEAYGEFAPENAMSLATDAANENVLVMRTFSKSYSLAGLRVGYCVGPEELIEAMYKVKDSYNVDALAQAVALAAVRDQRHLKANVRKIVAEREALAAELAGRGWDVLPSSSNFLFARPAGMTAAKLFAALREANVFVRYFPGPRTGSRLRITVGTPEQDRRLLKAIDRIVGG